MNRRDSINGGRRPAWSPGAAWQDRAPDDATSQARDPSANFAFILALVALSFALAGCPSSIAIDTPEQMVTVEDSSRDYVAMTHDGVVLRARLLSQGDGRLDDVPPASLDFWSDAATEKMRTAGGHALIDETTVESADGYTGRQFEFGRDQNGESFRYVLVLFATDDELHIIDAGGEHERLEQVREAVDDAIAGYRVDG